MQAVFIIGWLILGYFQIAACIAGIKLWLGFGTVVAIIFFFATAAVPFGSILDAAVSFYGAYAAWHWTWWQAALLTFPFAVLGVVLNGLSVVERLLEKRREAYRRRL